MNSTNPDLALRDFTLFIKLPCEPHIIGQTGAAAIIFIEFLHFDCVHVSLNLLTVSSRYVPVISLASLSSSFPRLGCEPVPCWASDVTSGSRVVMVLLYALLLLIVCAPSER